MSQCSQSGATEQDCGAEMDTSAGTMALSTFTDNTDETVNCYAHTNTST